HTHRGAAGGSRQVRRGRHGILLVPGTDPDRPSVVGEHPGDVGADASRAARDGADRSTRRHRDAGCGETRVKRNRTSATSQVAGSRRSLTFLPLEKSLETYVMGTSTGTWPRRTSLATSSQSKSKRFETNSRPSMQSRRNTLYMVKGSRRRTR